MFKYILIFSTKKLNIINFHLLLRISCTIFQKINIVFNLHYEYYFFHTNRSESKHGKYWERFDILTVEYWFLGIKQRRHLFLTFLFKCIMLKKLVRKTV